ncbi:MAG: hypothetical protein MI743_11950, partial [Sneathiellales bacterium]|nr:hypothetical protein [Sneathiellales bacterium]
MLLLILLAFNGCRTDKNSENNPSSADFGLSRIIDEKLDPIQSIRQLIFGNTHTGKDYNKNDSINLEISSLTENIINILIESYGKTPTDAILIILRNLDNSGFIPNKLYGKLTHEDFSTDIGQRARGECQKYSESMDKKLNGLRNINLLAK